MRQFWDDSLLNYMIPAREDSEVVIIFAQNEWLNFAPRVYHITGYKRTEGRRKTREHVVQKHTEVVNIHRVVVTCKKNGSRNTVDTQTCSLVIEYKPMLAVILTIHSP